MKNWIEPEVVFFNKEKKEILSSCTIFRNAFFFLFSLLSFVLAKLFEWSLLLSVFVDLSSQEALRVIAAPSESCENAVESKTSFKLHAV